MSTLSRTERGQFLFAVKEYGPPSLGLFIVAEPLKITTSLLGREAFLAFDIATKDGNEAQRIADYLNEHIEAVAFTVFNNHPMFNAKPPAV